MPWFITVPVVLAILVVAGYLVLGAWIRVHGPAVEREALEAVARWDAMRAAERTAAKAGSR
jgi:hypothetical protein